MIWNLGLVFFSLVRVSTILLTYSTKYNTLVHLFDLCDLCAICLTHKSTKKSTISKKKNWKKKLLHEFEQARNPAVILCASEQSWTCYNGRERRERKIFLSHLIIPSYLVISVCFICQKHCDVAVPFMGRMSIFFSLLSKHDIFFSR